MHRVNLGGYRDRLDLAVVMRRLARRWCRWSARSCCSSARKVRTCCGCVVFRTSGGSCSMLISPLASFPEKSRVRRKTASNATRLLVAVLLIGSHRPAHATREYRVRRFADSTSMPLSIMDRTVASILTLLDRQIAPVQTCQPITPHDLRRFIFLATHLKSPWKGKRRINPCQR